MGVNKKGGYPPSFPALAKTMAVLKYKTKSCELTVTTKYSSSKLFNGFIFILCTLRLLAGWNNEDTRNVDSVDGIELAALALVAVGPHFLFQDAILDLRFGADSETVKSLL